MIKKGIRAYIAEEHMLNSVVCDCCKKEYFNDDFLELQEFHHIRIRGGYGSVFGDEVRIECDICQHCLKKLIGDFYRVEGL